MNHLHLSCDKASVLLRRLDTLVTVPPARRSSARALAMNAGATAPARAPHDDGKQAAHGATAAAPDGSPPEQPRIRCGASSSSTSGGDDPHNMQRFISRQETDHATALRELRAGHKASCWSWWIMPTPPFIKNGVEVGSGLNAQYAIRSDAEALAYLRAGSLRQNYLDIMAAVATQLEAGTTPMRLLGIDVPRCEASVNFFKAIAHPDKADDTELAAVCDRVLTRLAASSRQPLKRGLTGAPKRL